MTNKMGPESDDLETWLRLTKADLYEALSALYDELSAHEMELSRRTLERTQLQQIIRELTDLSQRDALTGLLNRRGFDERLREEFARASRYGAPLCLVMIDIDNFKRINDRYGHAIGDVAIGHVARLLLKDHRISDILARYGGEEFVLLLPHTSLDGALILADRMRALVADTPYRTGEGYDHLTISLGLAACEHGLRDPKELLEAADRALYHSKRNGRNRVSVA